MFTKFPETARARAHHKLRMNFVTLKIFLTARTYHNERMLITN